MSEHVLLSILRESTGSAQTVLARLGIDPQDVQRRINSALKQGDVARIVGRKLPYDAAAQIALEFAVREARSLRQDCVDPEHLLLSLLREGRGIAASVLNEAGVTLELARAETGRLHAEQARVRTGRC